VDVIVLKISELQFSAYYISSESRQIFPGFISRLNLSLTRIYLVSMKTFLRPQSTMEYLYIILECKILLFYYFGRCSWLLISCGDYAIVFSWSLHWHRQYLDVMISLNGSRIQIWWCTCKQSSKGRRDDYLLSRDIIDFGDGLHGNVWHAWWTFYGGGWAMKMEWAKRSIFSIVEKQIMRLHFIYLFVCLFRWHTQIKRHE
jgi:hypothetical protein